jgi:acetylornithine deacetylase/succinyl-diaminopimelate desuccinylase-like protein
MAKLDEVVYIPPESNFARETIEFFQHIIQFDTTNPPGNETPAQEFVADLLRSEGFEPEIIESAPGRGNLVCRWEGSDPSAPTVAACAHMDVVYANAAEWTHPPFEAEVVDIEGKAYIWGRGAIDCKNTVASNVMAFIWLKRAGFCPKGTILLIVEADEEETGQFGTDFLLKNYFEKTKADYALNEGGGVQSPIGSKLQYTIQNSEKGSMWSRLRVKALGGHGSVQSSVKTNALSKMVEIIHSINSYKKRIVVTDLYREMVAGLQLPNVVKKMLMSKHLLPLVMKIATRMFGTAAQALIGSLITNTINPTMIKASNKENVCPDSCECVIDVRTLPGVDRPAFEAELRKIIGSKYASEVEILPIETITASASPTESLCYQRIEQALHALKPTALPSVPFFSAGMTDNRFYRFANIPAYGFTLFTLDPQVSFEEYGSMLHGKNERISVSNLLEGVEFAIEFLKLW